MDTQQFVAPQTMREIAAEAWVTYQTVKKWFQCGGVGMKPGIADRVRIAAERRGLAPTAKAVV